MDSISAPLSGRGEAASRTTTPCVLRSLSHSSGLTCKPKCAHTFVTRKSYFPNFSKSQDVLRQESESERQPGACLNPVFAGTHT